MHPEEVARRVREEIGSPDFLKRGVQTNWTNSIALFSNAIVQGWRSDFKAMKNDRTVLVKTILASTPYHALLWTAKAGLLYAAMKAIFGDDDDKTKYFKHMYEILQKIPDYDCMNYNIIPIGMTPNGQALYLRLPQDENAKLTGGILWSFLNTFKGKFEPMDMFKTLNYASDQLPGLNPVFALTHGALSYCGINIMGAGMPDDLQKHMTETMWKARWQDGAKLDALSEFGKWAWNTAGLSYFWKFQTEAQRNAPDEEGVYGAIQDSQSLPIVNDIISRFLKVSDTGVTTEVKQEALNPLRNEKAAESIIKKRIIETLYNGEGTSNFDDQERKILAKYRKDIIKEVRELRALRGASAEQRAILDTRSKEEKRTVRQFLNEK